MSRHSFIAAAHFNGPYLSDGGRVSVIAPNAQRFDHTFASASGAFDICDAIQTALSLDAHQVELLSRAVECAVGIAHRAFNSSRTVCDA